MRIVGDTNINFMSQRKLWLTISLVLLIASIGLLVTKGIRQGVEFAGGAQMIVRYLDAPTVGEIREKLTSNGLDGTVTTSELSAAEKAAFGDSQAGQDFVIRVALPEKTAEEDDVPAMSGVDKTLTTKVLNVLRGPEARGMIDSGQIDLNTTDQATLSQALVNGGIDQIAADEAADKVIEWRRTHGGIFASKAQLSEVGDMPAEAMAILDARTFTGGFGLRAQEFIEASVSGEMRAQAFWAIIGALGGMLIYIWVRFRFQFGIAAICALVHDTIITLGAFSLAGMEANLPVVAAFLTLVGYSVNDTIVVFDRVRENLRSRAAGKLEEVINTSINQNLSRTLITSLTTWLVVLSLFLFGGAVINPFAFVLLIGIVVGTYSSVYIASPVLLMWQAFLGKRGVTSGRATAKRKPARAAR